MRKLFRTLSGWVSGVLDALWQRFDKPKTYTDDNTPDFQTTYKRFRRGILRLGTFLAPSAIGGLIGYFIGYRKTLRMDREPYRFHDLPPKMRRYIFIGKIAWIFLLILGLVLFVFSMGGSILYAVGLSKAPLLVSILTGLAIYLLVSFIITWLAWLFFIGFLKDRQALYMERRRYGSASFSYPKDLEEYQRPDKPDELESHIYIGSRSGVPYVYKENGHGLIVAGTRAGKGASFIMPNLLGKAQFNGSWVVVDPKGESYWYTHQYHRDNDHKVVIINPWGVHKLGSDSLNPLDAFAEDPHRKSLGNDMRVIAESIIPMTQKASNTSHFNDRARTLIMAMLMHLLLDDRYEGRRYLATLFTWFSDLEEILKDMTKSGDSENHLIVSNHARQFLMLMQKGEREFASVLSTAQRAL